MKTWRMFERLFIRNSWRSVPGAISMWVRREEEVFWAYMSLIGVSCRDLAKMEVTLFSFISIRIGVDRFLIELAIVQFEV